jgi:hypothetical protein
MGASEDWEGCLGVDGVHDTELMIFRGSGDRQSNVRKVVGGTLVRDLLIGDQKLRRRIAVCEMCSWILTGMQPDTGFWWFGSVSVVLLKL